MQADHVQTTVANDGTLKLNNLPFPAGESVEVIIITRPSTSPRQNPYPLMTVDAKILAYSHVQKVP